MLGWVIAGMVAGAILITALDRFWDSIANWLNNTAANAIEKVLGYDARRYMQRAVATVTRVHDRLHNKTIVMTRQSALDTHIHKITLSSDAPVYEQEEDVRREFEQKNTLVNEFTYQG